MNGDQISSVGIMSCGSLLPTGSCLSVSEKFFFKCFSIIRDWFFNGTWIGCTASNAKESSVIITFFLLPYLYQRGMGLFRSELDPDGNHPLVREVQFHV